MGGYFCDRKNLGNLLVINEHKIKDIYFGDIEKLIVLLHELNHFKVKYDILLGKINEDIARIIKERLIREASSDSFDEKGSIKIADNLLNDDYYNDNYYTYSEEIYVQIEAIKDFSLIIGALAKNSEDQNALISFIQNGYKDEINELTKRYNNHKRDFQWSFYFNSYYLNFEEAFDLLILDHKEWLKYPGIAIEYYLYELGVIKKRNIEQLVQMLNTSNSNEINYINILIANYNTNIHNKVI